MTSRTGPISVSAPPSSAAQYSPVTIRFSVLGPLDVTGPGGAVEITGPKERLVLTMLTVWVGDVVSTDRLVDAVWGEQPPRSSLKILRNLVLRLRKALGSDVIDTRPGGYVLRAAPDAVDVWRFDRLVDEGRVSAAEGDWEGATAALSTAINLWRGPPLVELGDWPPVRGEIARLHEQHCAAGEELIAAELACGRHRECVAPLQAMVSDEPLRERRWELLMLALYRCGRQADALRAFQRARSVLAEVGLEPGPELRSLERDISTRAASLAPEHNSGAIGSRAAPLGSRRGRHNLPIPLTRFLGRDAELERIDELLDASRLVTLTGVGGAGKTRLAFEAATGAATRNRDGAWLCELGPARDETSILSVLTALFGITANGLHQIDTTEHLICDHLATRKVLLVFDNCEHLIPVVGRLVDTLLRTCPGVSVLATSRTPLGVPGEVVVAVQPLSLPPSDRVDVADLMTSDAVALFCARARDARPEFELTDANARAVVGICRQLDGIPLALELAAARIRMLTVYEMGERLDMCFRLLTGGNHTTVARHQTMRAALDWSYDLLPPVEQAALRRLGVFPDRFNLDAALAMVTPEGRDESGAVCELDGFELVSQLVDKSLVVADSTGAETRYRLLEPLRQYAAEKLNDVGELEAARDRHRDFFVAHFEGWRSQLHGLTHAHRIFADEPNYRAALEWSWRHSNIEAALCLVAIQSGMWVQTGDPQGRPWMERVLAEPEPAEHRARAMVLGAMAVALQHDSGRSDPERAEHLIRDASAMARRLGDREAIAWIAMAAGEVELSSGNTGEAREQIEAALDAYQGFGSWASVGWCHEHLGWVAVAEHDDERAQQHFERAVELGRRHDEGGWLVAHAMAALAPLSVALGDAELGLRQADEAARCARRVGVRAVIVMALVRAAETAILASEYRRAGDYLEELFALLRDVGSRRWVADALELATLVLESRGDAAAAAEVLGASAALRAASGERSGGNRALGSEIQRCRERLTISLGPDRLEHDEERGRRLSPEAAIANLLIRLAPEGIGQT